ncbi:hypothetical protein NDA13_004836 [Ustilago tritici]|nr:hypothetical protein NDA13_004836 [Ustilago tritici]
MTPVLPAHPSGPMTLAYIYQHTLCYPSNASHQHCSQQIFAIWSRQLMHQVLHAHQHCHRQLTRTGHSCQSHNIWLAIRNLSDLDFDADDDIHVQHNDTTLDPPPASLTEAIHLDGGIGKGFMLSTAPPLHITRSLRASTAGDEMIGGKLPFASPRSALVHAQSGKIERKANMPGKGGWWGIKPGHEDRFQNGLYNAVPQKFEAAKVRQQQQQQNQINRVIDSPDAVERALAVSHDNGLPSSQGGDTSDNSAKKRRKPKRKKTQGETAGDSGDESDKETGHP